MNPSRRNIPSLAALQALHALARHGSASAAAAELALTQSAVSRQLIGLEQQLGAALLTRRGRALALTAAGKRYAEATQAALDQIVEAGLHVQLPDEGGTLSLAILPSFGMRWLVPRLGDFSARHPEVVVHISTRMQAFAFEGTSFDAAIFFGNGHWPGTGSLRLMRETVLPVCAPALHAASAGDITQMALLHIVSRPDAWAHWFESRAIPAPSLTGPRFDQFVTITQAALHGMGVALLPAYLAEPELRSGRLMRADTPTPGLAPLSLGSYHLVWPATRQHSTALRLFRDWIALQCEEDERLPR